MEGITHIYELSDPRLPDVVRYIGKTRNSLKKRLYHHVYKTEHYNITDHRSNWIRSLLNAGVKPHITLIDSVPTEEFEFWERHYVYLYRSWGFDLTNATDGGEDNKIISTATRKKLSDKQKGIPLPRETYLKILESRRNNGLPWHSEETRRKMSIAGKGRGLGKKASEDTKNKMSASAIGKRCKIVLRKDLQGNVVEKYFSLENASELFDCGIAYLSKVIKLKRVFRGFTFEFDKNK